MRGMHARTYLRLEGLAIGVGAAAGFVRLGGHPVVLVALVLLPNLSMAGYLVDSDWGRRCYNAVHTLAWPTLLVAGGVVVGHWWAMAVGLAWLAHVGADRALGSGLKYADRALTETHLQRT
jgi:hypothetical protein